MGNLDIDELRSRIDTDGCHVDFTELRSKLSVTTVAEDSGVDFSEPSFEGEVRGRCPVCKKARSLSVNINTNRFNCFAKGCRLKGGGVIDFISKLHGIGSKEAAHLIACEYQLGPYADTGSNDQKIADRTDGNSEVKESSQHEGITRKEFQDLIGRFDRLSNLVWVHLLECETAGGIADEYDPPLTKHHVTT